MILGFRTYYIPFDDITVFENPDLINPQALVEFVSGAKFNRNFGDSKKFTARAGEEIIFELNLKYFSQIISFNWKLPKNSIFEENVLIPMNKDKLDKYRKEYNDMLLDKTINSNSMIQEKFLTITVQKKNYEEAKNYFSRIYVELSNHFRELGSKCVELDAIERLRFCSSGMLYFFLASLIRRFP